MTGRRLKVSDTIHVTTDRKEAIVLEVDGRPVLELTSDEAEDLCGALRTARTYSDTGLVVMAERREDVDEEEAQKRWGRAYSILAESGRRRQRRHADIVRTFWTLVRPGTQYARRIVGLLHALDVSSLDLLSDATGLDEDAISDAAGDYRKEAFT